MDLGKLDVKKKANKGVKLYLTSPEDGKTKLPLFLFVLGKDSDVYQNVYRSKQVKIMDKKLGGKDVKFDEKFFIESEKEDLDTLSSLVTGFGETEDGKDTDFLLIDAKKIKHSKDTVADLLVRFPWIKEQVTTFVGDRSNFLGD